MPRKRSTTVSEGLPQLVHDVEADVVLKGSRRVIAGLRVRISGVVKGDLIVEDGARVDLLGRVTGDLYAFGQVKIHLGATVRGRIIGLTSRR